MIIMDGTNIEKETDPNIITNHHKQSMNGLTLKIKNSLISVKQYNTNCNHVKSDDKNENYNESNILFHSVRRMFNEESKFLNNPNNILISIQDSNSYTSHAVKFFFIFRLVAEGKLIDCCQWNIPQPPDDVKHVLPTKGLAIFINVKFVKWNRHYHYLYGENSSMVYDFCPYWTKVLNGNIDDDIDPEIQTT